MLRRHAAKLSWLGGRNATDDGDISALIALGPMAMPTRPLTITARFYTRITKRFFGKQPFQSSCISTIVVSLMCLLHWPGRTYSVPRPLVPLTFPTGRVAVCFVHGVYGSDRPILVTSNMRTITSNELLGDKWLPVPRRAGRKQFAPVAGNAL